MLASHIYGLIAAGSLRRSVGLLCVPREPLLDTNFVRTLRAISGAADRFTAFLLHVAAGSLSLDFCDIVLLTVLQCI